MPFDPKAYLREKEAEDASKGFDPKAYLAAKEAEDAGGEFDPKAYLAARGGGSDSNSLSEGLLSALGAGSEHAGNAAMLGYAPQVNAAIEPIIAKAYDLVTGDNSYDYLPSYEQRRDDYIRRTKEQERQNPLASKLGTGAGTIAGGFATSPLFAVGKSVPLATRLINAGKSGALIGGISNPGDVEGAEASLQIPERLLNATIGAAVAPAVQYGGEKLVQSAPAAAKTLKDGADWLALRALGPFKKGVKKIFDKEGEQALKDLGRAALDEGLIPVFGGRNVIYNRAKAASDSVGREIGGLISSADETLSRLPTEGIKKTGDVVESLYQPFERTFSLVTQPKGKPITISYQPMKSRLPGRVDAVELSEQLAQNPVIRQLNLTPGKEGAAKAANTYLETLAKNGDEMTNAEAHRLRQLVDDSINYNKALPDMAAAQRALYEVRDKLRDAITKNVERAAELGGKEAGNLARANKRYNTLQKAQEIAADRYKAEVANQAVGLGDKIGGGLGMSLGGKIGSVFGPIGAAVGAAAGGALGVGANKFARNYGNQFGARALDFAGNQLNNSAWIAQLISDNPALAPYILSTLNRSSWEGAK
jgi:hypothetical protein